MNNNITATQAALVRAIIRLHGGYRERDILNHSHTMERGETWNKDHKVVNVLEVAADFDGHRDGCAVDITSCSIVG
jgi:hypothetical protein